MAKRDRFSRRIESTIPDRQKALIDDISSACDKFEKEILGKEWSKVEDRKHDDKGHLMEVRNAGKLDKSNIRGIAVGHKTVNDRDTEEPCIQVLVEIKAAPEAVVDEALVPPSYSGIATDTKRVGILRARSGSQLKPLVNLNPLQRHRPAPGGVSVGHISITAGTLGCWCTSEKEDALMLSNNHVLAASNQGQEGDPIVQPGPLDGGRDPRDKIAELGKFVPLDFNGGDNFVDAALAKPVNMADVSPEILNIGRVTGLVCNASINTAVQKSGRTTGHTTGEISGLNATVRVDYREAGTALFRGQYLITPGGFSDGGDSGSLIVTNSNRAIALLFGGSDIQTIANPICRVMDDLDITGFL